MLIGEIGLADALLGRGSDYSVTGRRGFRLSLGEAVWLARGRFGGGGFGEERRTEGFGVSVGGALALAGVLAEDGALAALGRRFDLRYARATWSNGHELESRFHTVTLAWRGW